MYLTSHFHSTTHEFLTILAGSARILLGGDSNPDNVTVEVEKGDAMFMPAGVAHKLLEDLSHSSGSGKKFMMLGSYPSDIGEGWDMCYGKDGEDVAEIERRIGGIAEKKWNDPVYGEDGPGGKVAAE